MEILRITRLINSFDEIDNVYRSKAKLTGLIDSHDFYLSLSDRYSDWFDRTQPFKEDRLP